MKLKLKFLFLIMFSSMAIFAQGELCDNAMFFDCGTIDGNNDSGLFNSEDYCGASSNLTGPEVVYSITPSNTQIYNFTLDVFGTGDLDMFLLAEDCDPSNCIASSDAPSPDAEDIMSVTLFTGITYYLVIDGDDGSIAEYFLEAFCSPPFECDAEDIFCDESIFSNNDTGTSTVDTYCSGANTNLTGPEKIFRFTPSVSQLYTINLTGFSGDLDMFILDSACDTDDCLDNSDGASGTVPDIIIIFLSAGQDYYIVVDGDGGTISSFDIIIECAPECEASFTWEEDCGKVQFTSTSTGNNLTYEWTIDGITYNIENPCHQFLTTGPHSILLEVFAFGCEDSSTQEIEVENCSSELFCECCDDENQATFETEPLGPITTFPQAPFNAVYGAPEYVADGCDNPISIQVNGPTLGFPGDGIEYSQLGINGQDIIFQEGVQYCISYCYKAPEEAGSLKLRISDTAQTSGACSGLCSVLHTSPVITPSDGWQTDQFTFTANNNYFNLTFSTDATGVLDGIVPILFDNVCISEYTDNCKADFSWTDDGCGNVTLIDESCGDNLNILWNVNGNTSTSSPYTISGPGTYNVTLAITGADGCSDSKTETITITSPTPPVLTCPMDETITQIILPNENCTSMYTVPPVSSNTGSSISCTFNGNIITPGSIVQLQAGINLFICTTINECDNVAECAWQVVLICEIEEPETCDIDPNCTVSNTINLGTGIDINGNLIPSGTGQVDPIWRLINNAPIGQGCGSPFLPTIDGSAYLMNYTSPNTNLWINLPGVTNIAPVDLGNGPANLFGCNNLQNSNGDRVPYVFERVFCICEEDELEFQFSYKGDDRLTLELWDLDNNNLLGTSTTFVYTGLPGNVALNWNYIGIFPQGSYALRAKLANTNSTTLGFSIIGSATSLGNNSTIINAGECCESYTVNVRKIIDNDCSSSVTAGDTPGQGWNFILKDAIGTPIQNQTTDINGEVFFTGLSLGNYTIEEVVIPGFSAISPVGGIQNITITQNSWNTYDFFNCQDPEVICDSLMVMYEEVVDPNNEDFCCYDFDLKNNWGPDIVNLEVEMLTKDWQFNNVVLDPGLQFGPCITTNDLFCVSSTTGSIPAGLNLDAINVCIAPAVMNPGSPQIIEFRWMQQVSADLTIVACRDTIILECIPPPPIDPCVSITECEIMCSDPDNPFEYELCFNLTNNSGFDIGSITLEDLPSNFGWQPFCTTSTTIMPIPNPIPDGTSSGQMCVKLKSSTPIVVPQTVCFKISVISVDGTECCHNPEEICKEIIPCCDPCEDNGITAHSYGMEGECCYQIDVDNDCQTGYFTKFEAEINTSGVCFGSHIIDPAQAGFWNVTSTNNSICMRPTSGTMDHPSYPGLLDFCLDKIDNASQTNPQITFKWYAINPMTGLEEVACTDLLETNCTPPDSNVCVAITDQLLECVPDSNKYRYTFTVTNVSNPSFFADKLHLTVKNDPLNYVPFPTGNVIPLTPPLGPNQSRIITTCIVGTPFPQTTFPNFEFGYRLQNMVTGDCCFESVCDTIPIPPCGLESCCDITEQAFCDYFDNLINYTELECKIIMNFDELDSCDAVIVTLPDGSTNTPDIGDELCIALEDGPTQICVQIDRWNDVIIETIPCFSKDTCFTVDPPCTPPPTSTCPDCPTGTTITDLVINGDFEAGNVGFTNDYIVGPPNLTTGQYDVRSSSFLGNPNWAATDLTNGVAGKMLVVDGPFPGAIWRQSVTVIPGETYYFCAWVNNLVTLNLNETFAPTIELQINGSIVINATAIPQAPDQWVLLTGSWVATSTNASLELINTETGGFGDIAVDNISFSSCTSDDMDECCEDFDAFCDLIDLSWDVTIIDCEVTVKATQFDSCHWMYNVSPDWGDGSILLPTISPANGCWTYEYDQSGTYNICATIYEGTMDGDTCWTKEICVPVTVECPVECCEDFDTFCDLIDLSWDVTFDDCEVTVKATQFDSCHWMYNVSPDWGDGSILLPTISPANGCWTHEYDQPGNYNICATIYEGTMDGDTCWTKEICVPVTIDCPTGCECVGWNDMTVSGTWGTINNVSCTQTVSLPECEYIFSVDGSFLCSSSDCNPSHDWSLTKIGGNCISPCIGNFAIGSNINLGWDLSPTADPLTSGPGTYELRINGSCSDDAPCSECTIFIVIPDCDNNCDPTNDPCDFVDIDFTPDPILGDICCYTTSIENQYCDDYFKGIKISLSGSATISQVQSLNGWTINQLDPLNAEIYPPGNFIGLGSQDIFNICASNDGTTFNVQISWLYADDDGNCISICPEEFDVSCDDIPGGCLEIVQDSIDCDNNMYCFKVINTTSPEIIIRSVEFIQLSPNGASMTPNPYSINPLMSGDTSEWICITYDALDNPDLCFLLVGHEADLPAGDPITWCCVDDEKYFINIEDDCGPPCPVVPNVCDDIEVTLTPDPITGDECCFVGSITNDYCAEYFKGVKITTQSPATIAQVQALNGWVINQINSTEAEIYPTGNYVTLGTQNIFSVCNATNVTPFVVTISWLVPDDQGNCIEECVEDFSLVCPGTPLGGCITIVEEDLLCDQSMYCFKITNNTNPGFTIQSIDLISISPAGTSLSPNPISIPPLMAGQTSDWICVEYASVADGEEVCFYVVGHNEDVNQGNVPTWCCASQEPACFTVECGDFCPPDCISVIQDSLACEERNYCFKIVNNTHPGFEINSIDLINILPQTASFLNAPVSIPTLMVGDTSDWICVEYAGAMPSDTLCFNVVAHLEDLGIGENPSWCCSASIQSCVLIEDCETCCQDEQGFIDLVDQGFDVTDGDCEITITTSQFDSCHWIPYAEPDWGDGSVSSTVITPANGNWTHTYNAPGTYNVCMEFYEGELGESNCWQSSYCMDVIVTCTNFNEDDEECDLNVINVPNGLTPNGDGINDVLKIDKNEECPPLTVTIYNRWGQKVFESDSYQNDWNGLSRSGDQLPDGTYYLVVGYNDSQTKVINSFIDVRR